ncbi:MAG TPA: hypothetical protein VG078_04285 [Acidimicrobiales bacterium]|nr:hypothetical protein [Acidimicrobiales bacterium]
MAGHARWLETRLFEVLGAWVAVEADPEVKALLAAHSLRHAWHADVWRDRLPRVAHLDADALTVPAGDGVAEVVAVLEGTAGADQTVERLAGVARVVLPRLVAAYRARLQAAHPLADGPTARWLGLVVADEAAALAQVDRLLRARLAVGEELGAEHRVAGLRGRLESLLPAEPGSGDPLTGLAASSQA